MSKTTKKLIGTHWGNYQVTANENQVVDVEPSEYDSNPTPMGDLLYDMRDTRYRIKQPMIRAGYLQGDKNNREHRGKEPFVPVSWEKALNLAAAALENTKEKHGNRAIYGGSYGWSSAGRFHHAQSQIHRFLNTIGGYTASVNTYSNAAAQVIVPYILGVDLSVATNQLLKYDDINESCDVLIAFGGLGDYNNQILPGGVSDHRDRIALEKLHNRGTDVITVSPLRSDTPDFIKVDWITLKPSTDMAFMLGIAYYLEINEMADVDFLKRYTVGYDKFKAYLLGETDGVVKSITWASSITGIQKNKIEEVALKLANASCPVITVSLSLQRAEHGEQPYWMANVLASMLGAFGKKGGGVGMAWGSNGRGLYQKVPFSWGSLPQHRNPIDEFIPVARIADMLLHPGGSYTYKGEDRIYPNIELIYWAGGNPFHHHQDLNRLRRAWQKPETVIVNESVWTATARHADIVFPANTFLERNDLVCGTDTYISPTKKVMESYGDSKSDYEIFYGLAKRLNVLENFSEGRDEKDWLKIIYDDSYRNAKQVGVDLPNFKEFWEKGEPVNIEAQLPPLEEQENFMMNFHQDPERHPLSTPSGKIEIFSSTINSFGYADCGGHPKWYDKREWLGALHADKFPLHMVSHQPRNKLHSQLDFGKYSRKDKINGSETVTINPKDAEQLGIKDGKLVRIFNDRGACLAGARLSDDVMLGVIALPTGAWYCPSEEGEGADNLELHGNPNVLTLDIGTSSLAQGPSAHSCLVAIEPYTGFIPDVEERLMPKIVSSTDG